MAPLALLEDEPELELEPADEGVPAPVENAPLGVEVPLGIPVAARPNCVTHALVALATAELAVGPPVTIVAAPPKSHAVAARPWLS